MKLNKDIQELIAKLNQNSDMKSELNELYKIDQNKAWRKIEKTNKKRFSLGRRISVLVATSAAAIGFLYFGILEKPQNIVITNKIERIAYDKSYIMTSKGEKIEFETDSVKTGLVQYEKGHKFVKCVAEQQQGGIISYNTIVVPKGETLKVELCDGTLVWLNSDSQLIYPSTFKKDSREVELLGEGYFEVVSNAKIPFVVKGDDLNVNVTGTKFNISNYNGQVEKYVTLVEGVVDVEIDNSRNKLIPAEQFRYNTVTKVVTKVNVNPLLYTSWTKDKIFLKDTSLEDIAVIIDRWFNIKVECSNNAIAQELFTGEIYRYDLPEDIMNFITKAANLKWETKGKGSVVIY